VSKAKENAGETPGSMDARAIDNNKRNPMGKQTKGPKNYLDTHKNVVWNY